MAHFITAPDPAPLPLPPGIISRQIDLSAYGHLSYHILEAGAPTDPLIILLHGFPELAFSWRKVILPLANAASAPSENRRRRGYHVIAPDQRGFGRTTGWDSRHYEQVDLHNFTTTMYVRDTIALVNALGYSKVECIVGHDAGAVTAAACATIRPDVFKSVVLLTHPFSGMPRLPFNTVDIQGSSSFPPASAGIAAPSINDKLRVYNRKHYKWYYSTHEANADMAGPTTAGGLREFLRGYFHVKSASSKGNNPHPLINKAESSRQLEWPMDEVVKMPYYYIMPLEATMPQAIERLMTDEPHDASKDWLPDEDLEVYVNEYARTTFQGGLNWYRAQTADGDKKPELRHDLDIFSGKRITIPCAFIGGEKDWGTYQQPGAIEKMTGEEKEVCDDFRMFRMVEGAGHWIPQEKPDEVVQAILELEMKQRKYQVNE
ncbi:epoxide hydrolase, putative [Talaromyces stipitatus ATCC 10500]|uniref:Epoxide hydrolase, putative n=1 Tax=Talaromyces stipitatus (strain ATCC 10500 / CBS 375.48 / QM 6759 / NRRL 1006) TaxID=441959 RepID=B8MCZ0_TALSN|nr:epoxide hydrolase, putative [Talaromyces stipitatus ATCC 10500]EED17516.1 epoxide hydrolase, putative [Talaromyces stipitatus ATCC 10500]